MSENDFCENAREGALLQEKTDKTLDEKLVFTGQMAGIGKKVAVGSGSGSGSGSGQPAMMKNGTGLLSGAFRERSIKCGINILKY